MATTNSLSDKTYRDKIRKGQFNEALRTQVVAEKICIVDRSGAKTISAPYITTPTVTVQALTGTYTPQNLTTTDDTLTVTDEFIVPAQIKDFEQVLSDFDLFYEAHRAMANAMAVKVDQWVLNELCENGTGTLTTPAGGFTTAANVLGIIGSMISKNAGYANAAAAGSTYLVVENTDLTGILGAVTTAGFRFADEHLTNGGFGNIMGVDIYVVRSGTFIDGTIGTKTWTNAGHRVGGVKKVATYAAPGGFRFEEKGVSGVTGKEIVAICYAGFKQWTPTSDLTIDITLA